jgi:hypothetical protein
MAKAATARSGRPTSRQCSSAQACKTIGYARDAETQYNVRLNYLALLVSRDPTCSELADRRIGMRDKRHPPWYGCAHIATFGVPAIWQVAWVMSGSVQIGAPTLRLSQAVLAGPAAGIKCTDRAESSWTRPYRCPGQHTAALQRPP